MKTMRQIQLEPIAIQAASAYAPFTQGLVRLCRQARDFAEEVYDTIAGVIEMPLRHAPRDEHLERLDTHMLRDIGRDRADGH